MTDKASDLKMHTAEEDDYDDDYYSDDFEDDGGYTAYIFIYMPLINTFRNNRPTVVTSYYVFHYCWAERLSCLDPCVCTLTRST